MEYSRTKKAKLNIVISFFCQIINLICGLIVPRLLIGAFGSTAFGATTSIANFLSYITLLEGGIGGVARAALYKPLADKNKLEISQIIYEIRHLFRVIGYVFSLYVLVLACIYKDIAHFEMYTWLQSFLLVLVISLTTFGQYFIGMAYQVLLQAAQQTYVTQFINILTTVLNTLMIVVLIYVDCSLIMVKFLSSCVFLLRPLLMWWYVKRKFNLPPVQKAPKGQTYLKQKWSGLGQHLAFFLFNNTDVAVLTLMKTLASVSVYAVYHNVTEQMRNIVNSFATGMEALFGDMLAKKEKKQLFKTFNYYDNFVSFVSVTMFSVTAVMIIPFVRVYTRGITDTNYIDPWFGLMLVLAALIACLRVPYHSITIAAGRFKETQWAAYGEAIINIVMSVAMVSRYGLIGVAIGTVSATLFRFIYYVFYLQKHILYRSPMYFVKRELVNAGIFITVFAGGVWFMNQVSAASYIQLVEYAIPVTIFAAAVSCLGNFLFYRSDFDKVIRKLLRR